MVLGEDRHPRILVAPGPYKESLSASEVSAEMEAGIRELLPAAEITISPMCDGGSGFVNVLTTLTQGVVVEVEVKGPLGHQIKAAYGILGDGKTAVIESAAAAGLALIPREQRNPMITSSFGVGELIRHAVTQSGCKAVLVGCGDSGTNDCGIGCAAALGVRFISRDGVMSFPVGSDLEKIEKIEESEQMHELEDVHFTVACNLTSILCGPEGTTRVYGPQKGACARDIERLSLGVDHFADLLFKTKGVDLSYVPGAGGAGGLAASLYAFCDSRLCYSFDIVHKYADLESILKNCDLVLTGEGVIDDRTATGKVACGLALRAKKYGIPVVAIVGSIAQDHEDVFYNGIDAIECIADGPIEREESIKRAKTLVRSATSRVVRLIFHTRSRI